MLFPRGIYPDLRLSKRWGNNKRYTEPRLSIRANTCGDGGGRSGKTDNSEGWWNWLPYSSSGHYIKIGRMSSLPKAITGNQ